VSGLAVLAAYIVVSFAAAVREWRRVRAEGERGSDDARSELAPLERREPKNRRPRPLWWGGGARGQRPIAGFARVAELRGADLRSYLAEPSLDALERSLRRLTEEADARAETPESALRPSSSGIEDEALVARCVLETDPDLATRLEFLALEGALEAEAAAAWWRNRG
jgi:hypothetical protein